MSVCFEAIVNCTAFTDFFNNMFVICMQEGYYWFLCVNFDSLAGSASAEGAFQVESLGKGALVSPFPICIPFTCFSCLPALAMTSSYNS